MSVMTDSKAKSNEEVAREIVKKISDAAIELAFVRHSLTSDAVDVDDDADVKTRVAAIEEFCEDVKEDTVNCLTGDDTGCLDESELDESNCELLWLQQRLTTAQSQLARQVIAEIQTTARPTAMAGDVLTDLFTRMGIEVKEKR